MEIDVSKLPFNIDVIKKIKSPGKLMEAFPVLQRYDAFKNELRIALPRAFELIVLLYSVNSPLIVRHDTAKAEAAEYFGYRVVDNEIKDKIVDSMLHGEDPFFNDMIVAYCRLQKNAKFSKMVAYMDSLYANITALRNGGTDKEKTKEIMLNIDKLEKDVDSMVSEFLNYDNNLGLKDKVFDEIENMSLGIRPEEIAEKLEAGEDPVGISPYGKDYDFKDTFGDRTKINPYNND